VSLALATVLILSAAVDASSDAPCPTTAALQAEIGSLSPHADWQGRYIRVWAAGEGLRLEMRDWEGTVVAERTLPAEHSCPTLTREVAVIASAWLAAFPQAPAPPSAPAAAPTPATVVQTQTTPRQIAWELGAGVGGTWVNGSQVPFAGTAEAELEMGGQDSFLGGLGQLMVSTSRAESLAGGEVHWERFGLGLGPRFRRGLGPGPLDVAVLALAGFLWTGGTGYASNASNAGYDYGGQLSLRWSWARGALRPWIGLDGRVWLRSQQIFIAGAPGQFTVPTAEIGLSLGAKWVSL
jgi:hypothetical protein